jgi:hypothetical protein
MVNRNLLRKSPYPPRGKRPGSYASIAILDGPAVYSYDIEESFAACCCFVIARLMSGFEDYFGVVCHLAEQASSMMMCAIPPKDALVALATLIWLRVTEGSVVTVERVTALFSQAFFAVS